MSAHFEGITMSSSSAPEPTLPRVERAASGYRLIVDDRPALLLGGQLHNSTPTDVALPAVLDRVSGLAASVVIGAASWSLVEPEEGHHDFATVDGQLEAARASGLRLILIWFGAFKNATSTYTPTWVRADPDPLPACIRR